MATKNISRSKANKLTAIFVAAAMSFLGVVYAPETIANTTISQLGLDIDGEATHDTSGYSVSISSDGNRVAIGAPESSPTAQFNDKHRGHVRIYDWDGSGWSQVGIDIDGEARSDKSGYSVSISSDGKRVAIGARGNGSSAGHVRIYEWDGSAWIIVGGDIDGEAAVDYSGESVSLSSDGSRVAIGATGNDGTASNAGHVRIYDWDGSNWNKVGADIDGEAESDSSGGSVSLSSSGSRVAIGARFNDGTGGLAGDAGQVRIYDWDGSNWNKVGDDIYGEAASDYSGESVSLSSDGSRVAIGATGNDDSGTSAGHVRIYDLNGSAWSLVGNDIDGEAAVDSSGGSVSLSSSGSRVAIGALANGGSADRAGHTRIFSLPSASALASASASASAPAPAPAPVPYQGPLPFLASPGIASAGEQITVTGIRLSSISSVQIDGVAAAIVSVEETSVVFTLPNDLEVGTKSIVFYGSEGKLTFFANLVYKAALPPAVVQPVTDLEKVNAGSFDGYVAVYAKGHEGKTLSWKIAGKWFKTEITSNYQVFRRKTAAVGVEVKVDLYIDGESQLSELVRTR